MDTMIGFFMLAVTGGLFFKYRPRTRESGMLCALCVLMGLMSFIVSGGLPVFRIVQYSMQAAVLLCCFLRLRAERAFWRRRSLLLRGRRRTGTRTAAQDSRKIPCGRCA